MSNLYSIGQMNQLGDALERAGFSADEITKLQQSPQLAAIRELLDGRAELILPKHFIDCDAEPCVPENWELKSHLKLGTWQWQVEKISFFYAEEQKAGKITGYDLQEKLQKKDVLNANVLDYLLQHPNLIPFAWKNMFLFFWGTVYISPNKKEAVRCLCWNKEKGRWHWFWAELNFRFGSNCPAAVSLI